MQLNAIQTIRWKEDHLRILDQTKLPGREIYIECKDLESVAGAIERLSVRGAPAIGIAAAMALAFEAGKVTAETFGEFMEQLRKMCARLKNTRPTAVNLQWALNRMMDTAQQNNMLAVSEVKDILKREALSILEEDVACNKSMGMHGQALLPETATVITICNAGSLATGGYGTSLGVIRSAVERGKKVLVVACETRPLLQGARLTTWELQKDNIPFLLITDSMAGYYMKEKGADLAISGADRIAANGDTANKIGTYTLAILAKEHGIPFYVAAPVSTIDRTVKTGDDIPIEERASDEITSIQGQRIAPESIDVWNPAFDVVPHHYISGIITEKGVIGPPFDENIKKLFHADDKQ